MCSGKAEDAEKMAARSYHAIPGGGESSDSDDAWDIGDSRELSEVHSPSPCAALVDGSPYCMTDAQHSLASVVVCEPHPLLSENVCKSGHSVESHAIKHSCIDLYR